jgi:hypothetical protein
MMETSLVHKQITHMDICIVMGNLGNSSVVCAVSG